jgi:hypothetical protein
MLGILQAMLIFAIPILLGIGLIYLGVRRARKETTRLKLPTTWDYVNQVAGYWIVGAIFVGYGAIRMLGLIGSLFT